MSFASVYARERFIEAKFNAIKEKARLRMVIRQNREDWDAKNKFDLLSQLHIDEDLTPRRAKLVKVVKSVPGVKKVYTRNAVIHAIREQGKVKLYSANDLYKIGVHVIPFDELDIPQRIVDMYQESAVIRRTGTASQNYRE